MGGTSFANTTFFEDNNDEVEKRKILNAKNVIEVSIMQTVAWLSLVEDNWGSGDDSIDHMVKAYKERGLSSPDLGGRPIANATKLIPVQVPHYDYAFRIDTELAHDGSARYPSYFAIASGEKHVPFWFLEGSHKLLYKSCNDMLNIGKACELRLVYMPEYSLAIVRGRSTRREQWTGFIRKSSNQISSANYSHRCSCRRCYQR